MKLTPSMIDATRALLAVMLEDAGGFEEFVRLPAMEQARVFASPLVKGYLVRIVGEALQSEADRLAKQ
jgi:hypothetical protein